MARSFGPTQPDPVASFMDGVQVKIAEAYKPPRKIALPAAYNNKFPDITKHTYDFSLERSVLEKLGEWRKVRNANKEAHRARIEERKRREQEKLTSSPPPADVVLPLPVKVAPAPETTILTPQLLSPPLGDLQNIDFNVKNNGLDYSDFDNDTSSPFDNMELKTINDMEELAQVLQPTMPWVPPPRIENILKELTLKNDTSNDRENQIDEDCSHDNDITQHNSSQRRNISIIVGELQRELNRPHMENWKPWPDLESPDSDFPSSDIKNSSSSPKTKLTLSNTLSDLKEDDKKLAEHLNDMGFELSRAARAIIDLGGKDNKKVVEYLLAVQHLEELGISITDAEKALALNEYDQEKAKQYHENLLTLKDLGFSEDQASRALLKCDIDRDKALDFLCA